MVSAGALKMFIVFKSRLAYVANYSQIQLYKFDNPHLSSLVNLYVRISFCPNHSFIEGLLIHVTFLLQLMDLTLANLTYGF